MFANAIWCLVPVIGVRAGSETLGLIGPSWHRRDAHIANPIALVIDSASYLSGPPRSSAAMGLCTSAGERTPIVSVASRATCRRTRPHWQYRNADNPRFAAMLAAKAHPTAMVGLGGVDVCDVPLAVRRAE